LGGIWKDIWKELGEGISFAEFGAPTELGGGGGGGVLLSVGRGVWGVISLFISFWLYGAGVLGRNGALSFLICSIPTLFLFWISKKYKERIFETFTTKLCVVLSFYFLFLSI